MCFESIFALEATKIDVANLDRPVHHALVRIKHFDLELFSAQIYSSKDQTLGSFGGRKRQFPFDTLQRCVILTLALVSEFRNGGLRETSSSLPLDSLRRRGHYRPRN
jgi:hypothetical protein